ncbi:hypothetical protein IWQ56_000922 [Coemansia nantahalensis]|nr:hypothetical protein IWQ56_000922 [Coemansia nantahalensis]
MPPSRPRKAAPPSNNSTLGKFFKISSAKPGPAVRTQPKLTTMLSRAAKRQSTDAPANDDPQCDLPEAKPEAMDVDLPDEREAELAADAVSSSDTEGVDGRHGGPATCGLSDSDSDDGLVDATSILGAAGVGAVSGYGLRPRVAAPTESPSTTASTPSTPHAAPYRNSLKSLVRESRRQKYSLDFLEERVRLASVAGAVSDESDASGGGAGRPRAQGPEGSAAVEMVLGALSERESEKVHAQLAADNGIHGRATRLSLFFNPRQPGSPGLPQCEPEHFRGQRLSDNDPVDRMCMARSGDAGFVRALLESRLLVARAHRGWRLTQGVGDGLLQAACFDADNCVAADAHETLCRLVDMGMSSWEFQGSRLLELLEVLLGTLHGSVKDTSGRADGDGDDGDDDNGAADNSCASDSLSVVVEITRPLRAGAGQIGAERAAYLLDIASRTLGFGTVKESCDMLVMCVVALLDHGNRMQRPRIQRALARAVERVPPDTWALVWPACVSWLGARFSGLRLPALLYIVDSLPTANQRCMQLRRSLSFMVLRMQTPEYAMGEQSVERLAVAVTLPSQIMLRMVSEMMDPDDELFSVGRDTDFARLEAAVGLLSNVLDSAQAMRAVRDEAETIHRRLSAMSQRINDGMATRLDKTLAKDAIQTLLVRISMTAMSVRSMGASASKTLDRWFPDA